LFHSNSVALTSIISLSLSLVDPPYKGGGGRGFDGWFASLSRLNMMNAQGFPKQALLTLLRLLIFIISPDGIRYSLYLSLSLCLRNFTNMNIYIINHLSF
jgi:hypothetical protein